MERKGAGTIAVYDLGGGTFDVRPRNRRRSVEVNRPTRHISRRRGFRQEDHRLPADEFKKGAGHRLRNDKLALQRLKEARRSQDRIVVVVQTEVNLPFITADQTGQSTSTSN